jgi:hypothetical protein
VEAGEFNRQLQMPWGCREIARESNARTVSTEEILTMERSRIGADESEGRQSSFQAALVSIVFLLVVSLFALFLLGSVGFGSGVAR